MHYDAATGKERKLNRIKLSDQIAEDLRVRIARDGLQPGDRLPHERALMEYYGCSKGTMREALKALEVEGLVRMLSGPNGGPEIQSTSSDTVTQQLRQYLHFQKVDFTQVYELRRPLEVILVRDVIGRLTQAQIARLEENIASAKRPMRPRTAIWCGGSRPSFTTSCATPRTMSCWSSCVAF